MNKTMTIRQDKESRKISIPAESNILSDPRSIFIIKNMTSRNARILKDFKKGRRHPPTCVCWLCIWRTFEKMRPVGPPYDYLTFLAYDIIEEITSPFQYEPVKQTSIKKLAREVIRRLPIINAETKDVLKDFARERFRVHFIEYSRKGRYQSDKLQNLIEHLMYQIHREAGRKPPRSVPARPLINLNRQPPMRAPLPLKIAKFVYSQPEHRATQRQLQRYTNKSKAQLEDLHEWLKWRYGIIIPAHEKWESTIYKGTCPTLPKSPAGKQKSISPSAKRT
jgi:hypothetical protein